MGPGRWALLLGAVALVVRLPLILGHHGAYPGPDSPFYLSLADDLLDGPASPRPASSTRPATP